MNRGIALLFTLLIISVAVSLSIGVFNIIVGELEIGEGARESTEAFYAADSGVECILYWDLKEHAFVFNQEKAITCANISFANKFARTSVADYRGGGPATVYTGPACPAGDALILGNGSCATLKVIKFTSGASRLESLGENTSNPAVTRVVQRGIEVNY
ncbi:MAG: pilus assembly PilX N-terminal domain-containing protein [Patescibacteria group bacterium]